MAGRNTSDSPDNGPIVDEQNNLIPAWGNFFTSVNKAVQAMRRSGATAQRPVSGLWIGMFFYDTTLGKPVWVHAVNPTVWHDASGAVV